MSEPARSEPARTKRGLAGRTRPAAGAAVLLAAVVGGGLALSGCGAAPTAATSASQSAAAACRAGAPKMTIHGSGVATGTPDLLTMSLSVDVTDATAQAALADDNTRTAAVIAALTSGGVAKADIQTTGLSIQPDYTTQNGTTVLTGYGVDNTVVAKLHNFATAGTVIDNASGAGGNAVQISSLTFSVEDPRPLEDQARTDAVDQAVSHAQAMAAAAGDRLGPVCSLTDQTPTPTYQNQNTLGFGAAASAASSTVPLEAGSQQVSAQVALVYRIEPAPPPRSAGHRR